jgi:hypothetical protein
VVSADSDGTGIGLENQAAAHIALGHTVAIAVELHTEVFVHEQFDAVTVIVRPDRSYVNDIAPDCSRDPLLVACQVVRFY